MQRSARRAENNITDVATENIVAIADVDRILLDRESIEYLEARKYRDYRKMLEAEEKRINAVVVGNPDHSHAPAYAMALWMNKHIYREKLLTNTVYEARTFANLAKENDSATQRSTQIHALDSISVAPAFVSVSVSVTPHPLITRARFSTSRMTLRRAKVCE